MAEESGAVPTGGDPAPAVGSETGATNRVINGRGERRDERGFSCEDEAQARLSELFDDHRLVGGVSFPTTASKVRTIVGWLLDAIDADITVRVVWTSPNALLLTHALAALESLARFKPTDFSRTVTSVREPSAAPAAVEDESSDVILTSFTASSPSGFEPIIAACRATHRSTILVIDDPPSDWYPRLGSLIQPDGTSGHLVAALVLTTAASAQEKTELEMFHLAFPDPIFEISAQSLGTRAGGWSHTGAPFFDGEGLRIPPPGSPWGDVISEFALTYNGYSRHGDMNGVSKVVRPTKRRWAKTRTVMADLDSVRCALFEMQRQWHWGNGASAHDLEYVDALLTRMIELTGGVIPGRPDPSI